MAGQPRNFQLANVLLSDAKRTAFRLQPHCFLRLKAMLLKRHGATAAKGLHFRLIPKRV